MSLLLHLSDTHFGTEQPQVVDALLQLVREQQPELAILSGDITQRARRSEFREAKTFMDLLGIPQLVIPGNHDIPLFNLSARLVAPYANHLRSFGPDLEPVYRSPSVLAIGVRTTRRYRHKNGEVSPEQILQVCQQLAQATPEQLRIVIVHHPVHVTQKQDEENLLFGRMEAMARWAKAGCDLILGGHIHLPYVTPLHEQLPLTRRLWAVQAGTALSTRIRRNAGNSVNLLRYRPEEGAICEVQRWDYHDPTLRFEPGTAYILHLERP